MSKLFQSFLNLLLSELTKKSHEFSNHNTRSDQNRMFGARNTSINHRCWFSSLLPSFKMLAMWKDHGVVFVLIMYNLPYSCSNPHSPPITEQTSAALSHEVQIHASLGMSTYWTMESYCHLPSLTHSIKEMCEQAVRQKQAPPVVAAPWGAHAVKKGWKSNTRAHSGGLQLKIWKKTLLTLTNRLLLFLHPHCS